MRTFGPSCQTYGISEPGKSWMELVAMAVARSCYIKNLIIEEADVGGFATECTRGTEGGSLCLDSNSGAEKLAPPKSLRRSEFHHFTRSKVVPAFPPAKGAWRETRGSRRTAPIVHG